MSLLTATKNTFILLAVLSLNSFGLAAHSSAMSAMSYEMGGMDHQSNDANSCAALCRTAVISKQENGIIDDENEDDSKPALLSVYTQNQSLRTDEKSLIQILYAAEIKPPPKVPIYILHSVFRV